MPKQKTTFLVIVLTAFILLLSDFSIAQPCPCTNPGTNLIVNADFSAGNTGFSSGYFYCNTAGCLVPEGKYAVGINPKIFHTSFAGSDHTTGSGNFMIMNGVGTPNTSVWCQTITVTPNTNYCFSTWVSTLVDLSFSQLQFSINGVPLGAVFNAPPGINIWQQFSTSWNSGANTLAAICIVNQNIIAAGNDFGLDDISFTACCSVSPSVTANPTAICAGDSVMLTASGGSAYLWNTNATTASVIVIPTDTTTYTVTVTDNGCTGDTAITVVVNPRPAAAAWNNVTITQGHNATLSADGGGNYQWSNGATDTVITVTPAVTTIYCVTITDANGCTDTACVTVTVEQIDCPSADGLYLPNAFSPNGDGENDALRIHYSDMECIKTCNLIIYSRWGEEVFSVDGNPNLSGETFTWDGTRKGEIMNTAVFVYYANITLLSGEEIIKKGNISLMK